MNPSPEKFVQMPYIILEILRVNSCSSVVVYNLLIDLIKTLHESQVKNPAVHFHLSGNSRLGVF